MAYHVRETRLHSRLASRSVESPEILSTMYEQPVPIVVDAPLAARSAIRRATGSLSTVALCGLLYLAALELGGALRFPDSGFAALWPANAVLLSALMLAPVRRWWLYLLAV